MGGTQVCNVYTCVTPQNAKKGVFLSTNTMLWNAFLLIEEIEN